MKNTSIKRAFTLIELLVVITIIGILATGATSIYTSQIQKARDSTRLTDIKSVQSSIEQYYQDTSVYPNWASDWLSWSPSVVDYLPELAEDPKNNQTCNGSRCWYIYTVWADDNWIEDGSYELSTAFENEWNKTSKAPSDSGQDNERLEIWLMLDTLDTAQDQNTAFDWSDADDSDSTVVIVKNNVVKQ